MTCRAILAIGVMLPPSIGNTGVERVDPCRRGEKAGRSPGNGLAFDSPLGRPRLSMWHIPSKRGKTATNAILKIGA